jgi:CheY-like chemotaxis protein
MKIKEPKYKYDNVMLVDDSELDNFINEKILQANFFSRNTYVHTSAKSALEFISNLMTMGEKYASVFPQVLFIDINMPMMDGFQFIEQYLKEAAPRLHHPRIIILTSSVYHEDRMKAARISPDIVFLNKPLTKEMLDKI